MLHYIQHVMGMWYARTVYVYYGNTCEQRQSLPHNQRYTHVYMHVQNNFTSTKALLILSSLNVIYSTIFLHYITILNCIHSTYYFRVYFYMLYWPYANFDIILSYMCSSFGTCTSKYIYLHENQKLIIANVCCFLSDIRLI